jgi:hypothetical protein
MVGFGTALAVDAMDGKIGNDWTPYAAAALSKRRGKDGKRKKFGYHHALMLDAMDGEIGDDKGVYAMAAIENPEETMAIIGTLMAGGLMFSVLYFLGCLFKKPYEKLSEKLGRNNALTLACTPSTASS